MLKPFAWSTTPDGAHLENFDTLPGDAKAEIKFRPHMYRRTVTLDERTNNLLHTRQFQIAECHVN